MTSTRSGHLRAAAVLAVCAVATPAGAYTTFNGLDLNAANGAGATTPLATTPNSSAAETAFKSGLVGVGTETFESQPVGATSSLILNFPGAGTATLTSSTFGAGVYSTPVNTTDGAGRYSVPSASSTRYWLTGAGDTFTIDFAVGGVAAFGFFGVDVGDFGGSLGVVLTRVGGGTDAFSVPLVAQQTNSLDGSVLFFGVVASDSSELFTRASLVSTSGSADFFGFDNLTVGSLEQRQGVVSEPGTIALFGALLALRLVRRRR